MSTPVSGPGQFSKRTDTAVSDANNSLPNAQYGENQDYQDIKSAAPLASGGNIASSFSSLFGNPASSVTGLNADSTMPDVPVTDGAAAGPGQGMEALSSTQGASTSSLASQLIALEFLANQPGSSDAARNLVRMVKSQM